MYTVVKVNSSFNWRMAVFEELSEVHNGPCYVPCCWWMGLCCTDTTASVAIETRYISQQDGRRVLCVWVAKHLL